MTKNFQQIETQTAKVYNIFTALFCEPSKEVIKNDDLYQMLAEYLPKGSESVKYAEAMSEAAKKADTERLLVDYTRLFMGPFKMMAPPYSAMYFGETKSLMNDATLWVISFMQELGFQYNKELKDAPDHIAIEMELLYYLKYLELEKFDKNPEEAKRLWKKHNEFIDSHLKKWVPQFCEKIIKHAAEPFYENVGKCLKSYLDNYEKSEFPEIKV